MRLGIFSDVHGNLPALEAVLQDARRRGVEEFLHLGDLVGYGPRPDEVVERLRAEGIGGVVGNYDLAVLEEDPAQGERFLHPRLSQTGRRAYRWTRERVSERTRARLRELPAQLRIGEGEREYLCCHGSPERADEYLLPALPEERLRCLFSAAGVGVLAVGHTHVPQVRTVGERLLLNPGSVGRPKDGDWRASYMILDTEAGLRVENIRVEFDVERVVRESIEFGLPPEGAESLRSGRGA